VTYQLVKQLAKQALLTQQGASNLSAFQFQVRMELPNAENSQLMLQSPVVPQ
jgi:hypothetical protein